MSESLKQRVQSHMKAAMRARDKRRLGVIRLILAAVKQVEVDERIDDLDDARVLGVLQKMLKQRQDSIEQYRSGNRQDLADIEAYEVEIIQAYMPQPLNEQELDAAIEDALRETGATSMREMGMVMALLKGQIQGRADMGAVSGKIKQRLTAKPG